MNEPQNNPEIERIFHETVQKCQRSFTKNNLHPEPIKERLLAAQLEQVTTKYGQAIAGQFQNMYQQQNPALSVLFAQVSNAMLEKTFHDGRCQLQAAFALFELCKKGIFNVSLVCSGPLADMQHFYLLLFDEFTFNALAKQPSAEPTCFKFKSDDFTPTWKFFDAWSNQLCQWKDFQPQNNYTRAIKSNPQAVFKPFIHLFKDKISLFENIIWCLTEYAQRLSALNVNNEQVPAKVSDLFTPDDPQFQEEMELLFNLQQCMDKLLLTIESYKVEFTQILELYKQNIQTEGKKEDVQEKLFSLTRSFFQQCPLPAKWQKFPDANLQGKYVGHQVFFFTMPINTFSQASDLVAHLKEKGADAELKTAKTKAGDKPSVVVDMSTSVFKL